MKVIAVIQARTSSTRLPNKVLLDVYGVPLLERVIGRAQKIRQADELWVATSSHDADDIIELMCSRLGVRCFRGDLADVRSRFHSVATRSGADLIVRITADNPLTEPLFADELITHMKENRSLDYARMKKDSIPEGTGSEVFTYDALEKSVSKFGNAEDREHVTPSIIREMKMSELTPSDVDYRILSPLSLTVDTFEEYKRMCRLFQEFDSENTLKGIIRKMNSGGRID